MISNLEQTLIEKIHILPPEKQAKVLEYIQEIEVEGAASEQKNDEAEEARQKARHEKLMSMVGIASGRKDLSTSVDEILAEGANKREGWSLP